MQGCGRICGQDGSYAGKHCRASSLGSLLGLLSIGAGDSGVLEGSYIAKHLLAGGQSNAELSAKEQ